MVEGVCSGLPCCWCFSDEISAAGKRTAREAELHQPRTETKRKPGRKGKAPSPQRLGAENVASQLNGAAKGDRTKEEERVEKRKGGKAKAAPEGREKALSLALAGGKKVKGDRIEGVDNNKPEAATKSSTRADVPSDGNEEGGGKKERNHDEAQQPQDVEDKPAEDAPLSAVDFPPTASPADLVDRAMEATKQLFECRIQEYGATREVFIKETNGFREELLEGVKVEAVKMITKLEARDYGQLKSVEERVVRNTQYEAAKKASFKKLEDEIKSSLYLPVRANELESARAEGEKAGFAEGKKTGFAEGEKTGFAEGEIKGEGTGFAKGILSGAAAGVALYHLLQQ